MTYHKLNLGCGVNGEKVYPGYLNVDLERGKGVNLVADIRCLMFKPDCIDEILLEDVFEHFSYSEATGLLQKFHSWLKQWGVLSLTVPNIRVLARNLSRRDCYESMKWIYGADGSRGHREPLFHHWGYSETSLCELLAVSGFGVVKCWTDCNGFRLCVVAQKQ